MGLDLFGRRRRGGRREDITMDLPGIVLPLEHEQLAVGHVAFHPRGQHSESPR